MAVPITVLQKGSIQFQPPLSPDRQQAFREIGMDKGGKLFLKLKSRLWCDTIGFINLEGSRVCQEWWEHNGWAHDEDPSRPLIIASLITEQTHYDYIRQTPDWQHTALSEIGTALSLDLHSLEDSLLSGHFEDWGGNEYIGGMYSYPNLEFRDDSRKRAGESEDRRHFVGEWSHESDFATIHGAVEMGLALAERLVK